MNNVTIDYCKEDYWEFMRTLRNDKRVSNGFIQSNFITKEGQKLYMAGNSEFYRVAILNEKPVGYVGVIEDDIRVCIHPNYQGLGIGKFLILKSIEIWPNAFAKIKLDNTASLKLFESCGFRPKYLILERECDESTIPNLDK